MKAASITTALSRDSVTFEAKRGINAGASVRAPAVVAWPRQELAVGVRVAEQIHLRTEQSQSNPDLAPGTIRPTISSSRSSSSAIPAPRAWLHKAVAMSTPWIPEDTAVGHRNGPRPSSSRFLQEPTGTGRRGPHRGCHPACARGAELMAESHVSPDHTPRSAAKAHT